MTYWERAKELNRRFEATVRFAWECRPEFMDTHPLVTLAVYTVFGFTTLIALPSDFLPKVTLLVLGCGFVGLTFHAAGIYYERHIKRIGRNIKAWFLANRERRLNPQSEVQHQEPTTSEVAEQGVTKKSTEQLDKEHAEMAEYIERTRHLVEYAMKPVYTLPVDVREYVKHVIGTHRAKPPEEFVEQLISILADDLQGSLPQYLTNWATFNVDPPFKGPYNEEYLGTWQAFVKVVVYSVLDQYPLTANSPNSIVVRNAVELDEGKVLKDIMPLASRCAKFSVSSMQLYSFARFGTPRWFGRLGFLSLPLVITDDKRMEGHWIVAPPGTGKTTLLSHLIFEDLKRVEAGKCCVVVIEGKNALVEHMRKLALFAKGGSLEGKLLICDPTDDEYPLALNLFSVGEHSNRRLTTSLVQYTLRSIIGSEMSPNMDTMFVFAARLLMEHEGATLDDLERLFQPNGLRLYTDALSRADADTQNYFANRFSDTGNALTKSAILNRISAIKSIDVLANMFKAKETRVDFVEQLSKPQVILINNSLATLQAEGQEFFGRFMLKLILNSAQQRMKVAAKDRLDVLVYLDEAHDVIHRDESITTLVDQARESRVGMILAHQRVGQLSTPVHEALSGSMAIIMASNNQEAQTAGLARVMGANAEDLRNQPVHSFATYVRGITRAPASYTASPVSFASMPKMSATNEQEIRDDMRRRYSIPRGTTASPPPSPESDDPTAPTHR